MTVYKNEVSGKFDVYTRYKNYKNEVKQKRKTGFTRKKDAKEWEDEFLNKCQHELTLEMALEEYLTYVQLKRRESTYRNKKWYSKNLANLHNLFIEDITPSTILAWQKDLKDNGKTNKTINQCTEILYSVFKHNCLMYNKTYNPVATIEKLEVEEREIKVWTLNDFNLFESKLEKKEQILAFRILFFSGIRYGELLGLTVSDIHDTYIDINKAFDYRSKVFCKTKNSQSVRKIEMPKFIMDEIREFINTLYNPPKNFRLFQHSTNTWLQSQMKRTCEKYELNRIRIHDLRHSHASLLINNGVDIFVVSKRLGHKNITTTAKVYAHLYEDRSSEAVDLLNELTGNNDVTKMIK